MNTTLKRYTAFASLALLGMGASTATAEDAFVLPGLPDFTSPAADETQEEEAGGFSFEVFRQAVREQKGNVTFSPASLEHLLRLLRELTGGEARRALDSISLCKLAESALVKSANALFVDSGFPLRREVPEGTVRRTPMKTQPAVAAAEVNKWCAERTEGHIQGIATPGSIPAADMAAFSALAFHGKWQHPFPEKATREEAFHLKDGGTAPVQMMHQGGLFLYAEDPDGKWRAIALPYKTPAGSGETVYFIGILPEGDAREFAQNLDADTYQTILRELGMQEVALVELSLPRISLHPASLPLREILSANGMAALFSGGIPFPALSDEPLELGGIFQECTLELNHTETVATAVTTSPVIVVSLDEERLDPVIMKFDRPFIWSIGAPSANSLPWFLGLYEKPEAK